MTRRTLGNGTTVEETHIAIYAPSTPDPQLATPITLAKPAGDVSLADVIRAVDGPLANVRGQRSEQIAYHGSAEKLRDVWVAVRASLRGVLETVTLEDLARGELPENVRALAADPDAWAPH